MVDSQLSEIGPTEIAKSEMYDGYDPDTRDEAVQEFAKVNLSLADFLCAYGKYAEINSMDVNGGMKATAFSRWVDTQQYTKKQAAAVKNELVYFNMSPASSKRYDDFVDAGLDPDDAYDLAASLSELVPAEGENEVSNIQRWRECVNFSGNSAIQFAALRGVMDDNQFAKCQMAYDFDVEPDTYVSFYEIRSKYDADGNGSYTQAEIKATIDSMEGLSNAKELAGHGR